MSRLLALSMGAVVALLLFAPVAVLPPLRPAAAQDAVTPSSLPVPRFATIGSSRVHLRQGPSQDHRILWVYEGQQGLPVEVVAETETWRQIRDPDGDLGWVHRSLLSGRRSVIVTGRMRPLRRRPSSESPITAYLEPRVIAHLEECDPEWCEISVEGYRGWVRHDEVWGVYPLEVVE